MKALVIASLLLSAVNSYAVDCGGLERWVSNDVYVKGDNVQYRDSRYSAKWWTTDERPTDNNVWLLQGRCDALAATTTRDVNPCEDVQAWEKGTVYLEGDQVSYQGKIYHANWWTQSDDPARNNGIKGTGEPWTLITACDISDTLEYCQGQADNNQPCIEEGIRWVRTPKPNSWCSEWGEWAQVEVKGEPNSIFKIEIDEGYSVKETTSNKLGSEHIGSMTAKWGNPHVFTGTLDNQGRYQFDYKVHWKNPETCHGDTLSSTGIVVDSTEIGKTEIRPTPNDSERIIVAIKDDGLYNSTKLIIEWMKHLGVQGKIGDALHSNHFRSGAYNSSWEKYVALAKEGFFDVINHSQSNDVVSSDNMYSKIINSQQELEKEFNNRGVSVDVLGFVFPQAKTNGNRTDIINTLKQSHYAAKSLDSKDINLNPLHPSDNELLALQQKRLGENTRSSDMIALIDELLKPKDDDNRFLLIAAHGCDPEAGSYTDEAKDILNKVAKSKDVNQALSEWSTGYNPTPCHVWYDMFQHLKTEYDDSEYWFAGLTDVVKYVLQARYTEIDVVTSSENKIILETTRKDKIKRRNTLGERIFDMPMLVRTQVPNNWSSAFVDYTDSNLQDISVSTIFEKGKNYIYYDLIPGEHTITLTPN